MTRLAKYLASFDGSIVQWNDHHLRTKQEVIDKLRWVAERGG